VRLKKSGLFLLVSILCLSLLLIGCPKKERTISWWHLDTQDHLKAAWQKMADDFMAKNPHVTIEITVLENEAFKQKIKTLMQSGDPPDLFRSWGGGTMIEYANAGLLKDITKYVKGDWAKKLSEGAFKVYSYNGKYYGAPYDMGAVGFWYNKAIFNEAGIQPFKTWSELLDGCKKIKDAGYIPIAVGEGDKWPGHFWWVYLAVRCGGKEAFEKAYNRTGSFADQPFVMAGEKLQELVKLEPFQTGFLGQGYNDEASLVGNRKAAMELMGQWAPYVQQANTDDGKGLGDDLGWFPFPVVEGGAGKPGDILGGGNGYIIGKNAPKEAVEFLKFITTDPENVKNLIDPKLWGVIPTVKGAASQVTDPYKKQITEMVAEAEYFQLYYDQALPPAVAQTVLDAVQNLLGESTTPKEAAEMIEKSMVEESE